MLKVFVADDSEAILSRFVVLFDELEEIELIGMARNPSEALEALQELEPDVVILDVRMKEGGGLRVLKDMMQQAAPPLVIMLTAFPYPQYRKRCLEAGASYFLDKSRDFERLSEVLLDLNAELKSSPAGRRPYCESEDVRDGSGEGSGL
jgi:DNA-binding NarL/FixJ family response regulator